MKDFFKRIGKGIKKVGRKIGDFFESKVGKILGGIMLAVALPQIFSSFFSGTVTTGAGQTLQTTMGDKIVGSAVKGAKITSPTEAVSLGQKFKAAAKQMGEVFTSPKDATKRTLDFMTGGKATGGSDFVIPQDSSFTGTSFARPRNTIVRDVKTAMNEGASVQESFNFGVEHRTDPLLKEKGYVKISVDSPNIPFEQDLKQELFETDWVNKQTGEALTQDQLTAHRIENTFTTRTKEKLFQNPKVRKWYDDTSKLLADSETYDPTSAKLGLKPSSAYRGVSEFPTLGQTKGPINQLSHVYNKSWGELTGYEGALSEASVAKTGKLAYTTGTAMFGERGEYKTQSYNPAAVQEVRRNLELGSDLISSRQASSFYEPLKNATPQSASSIIKNIHQKVGMGYAYGAYAPFNNYADT
mgnify:CR=1 FL=1|tara:strand:- start:9424 stop:10662 length:1239 start_codon:yes stop_codon:yes gene_type:complete